MVDFLIIGTIAVLVFYGLYKGQTAYDNDTQD